MTRLRYPSLRSLAASYKLKAVKPPVIQIKAPFTARIPKKYWGRED